PMPVHAAAIFLSAFLLFQIQPLAGKELLPWFGGSAEVWSACLLFFQAVLFVGYLYAHLVGTRLAPRAQGIVHLTLLALSLAFLPISAGAAWRPLAQSWPVPRILGFLAATIGLPYFLLSANGPLLQRWYTLRSPGAPWRLYALSNFGSLLGLLSYPLLVEPALPLTAQRALWSSGYALFVAAVGGCALGLVRAAPPLPQPRPADAARATGGSAADTGAAWTALVLGLSLTGSLLMAATTHYLCQHVAVIPLLWILPLALYLASFIVVFAGDRWYRRGPLLALLAVATVAAAATLFLGFAIGLLARVAILLGHLAVGCLVLHGEMARLKPAPRRLTGYYLLLSAGGALGTAFVTFAAPALFSGYWEYHVALAACWGLALAAALRGGAVRDLARARGALAAGALSLLVLVGVLRWHTLVAMAQTVRAERNFYGALQVIERDPDDPARHRFELTNGGILHGAQFTDPALRRQPTVYFGPGSGLAAGIAAARAASRAAGGDGSLRIGCVGLGVGVIAAHTRHGDELRYYELNPAVETVARNSFTFLADAPGRVEVVLGDARLSLERELESGSRRFDLFIVDAFTGDAIPAHLLTRECVRLYLAHLAPGGRLMLHVSNRYLDLRPLIIGLARDAGREALITDSHPRGAAELPATWAAIAPAGAFSADERALAAASRPPPTRAPVVWTDEYSNLVGLLDPGR
ncbi:MAG TPA: fused MFS/spermidine synthase, partial [Candidatus Methanoperedens sp.]|nr:fused MFS/spermidine synthase [Candidatus Methanoperedens sp.]